MRRLLAVRVVTTVPARALGLGALGLGLLGVGRLVTASLLVEPAAVTLAAPQLPSERVDAATRPTDASASGRFPGCFKREREGARFVDAADSRADAVSTGTATAPRAEPILDGPFVREVYADGTTHFEAQRVLGPDGEWLRHGSWKAFHENGAPHELGRYRLGVEDGPWEWWHPNGERMAMGRFHDGERVGPWVLWNEDGTLNMTGSYVVGVRTGRWSLYRPNGLLRAQGSYSDDELSGPWTTWRADGTVDIERSGTFAEGVRVGD